MEYKDGSQFRRVRYPRVFIFERDGIVQVANAVSKRGSQATQSLPWHHIATLYITQGVEGFSNPPSPKRTLPLYFNFVFGNNFHSDLKVSFNNAYGNDMLFHNVIDATEYKDTSRQWAQNGYANFNVDAVNEVLSRLGAPNNVIVNIGGGPSITWIGLVRGL